MKNSFIFILVCFFFILLCPFAQANAYLDISDHYYDEYRDLISSPYAQEYQAGESTIYIHDHAKVFSADEIKTMRNAIHNEVIGKNVNILILTTQHTTGKDEITYSDDYMDVLLPTEENNLAVYLDLHGRVVYINSMGMFLNNLSSSDIEHCLDAGFDDIADAEYAEGLTKITTEAIKRGFNQSTKPGFSISYIDLPQLGASAVVAGIFTAIIVVTMLAQHNKANVQLSATRYLDDGGSYTILQSDENFVTTYTTVNRNYYKEKSSGGGGSHRSSSGRSHGGGGRRF